jgi:tetratricopeptide (TPR) repeat protein
MRMARLAALFLLLAPLLRADPADELVRAALAAEARLDSAGALQLFLRVDAARPNDPVILQKIATQYSDLVPEQTNAAAKKDFALRALGYAQRAVSLAPDVAVNVLSLAICHGRLALVSDTRARVEYSRLIKEEAERALQLDPNYAWAHHVLGRWHYEVASFGPAARFFARLLYGGIPAASAEEGVTHLRRATELEPAELSHWLELGFAHAATGRNAEARASWERGLAMPDRGKNAASAKIRAQAALAALD